MKFRQNTKKLLAGALAAGFLTLQVPAAAFAATDAQSGWGAKLGLGYLANQQLETGKVPGALGGESDWAAIAIEAAGGDAATFEQAGGASVVDYIKTELTSDATDVARRMLAIAAIGGDTTDFGGTNYNTLLNTYVGADKELGNDTFLSDEAFAIMAIAASGDPSLYPLAEDSLNLLLANQNATDGSFNGGTCGDFCVPNSNDTATAIIAVLAAQTILTLDSEDMEEVITDAMTYLLSTQQDDGGFIYSPLFGGPADTSSTAWALMALNATGKTAEAQEARSWLLARQNADGGFDGWMCGASDVSATVHIIIALAGTTWLLEPASIDIPNTEPELIARDDCPVLVPTTPAETPEPAPTPETPAPVVPASTPTSTTTTEEPQTLTAETSEEPAPTEETPKTDTAETVAETGSSAAKYVLYVLVALSLITIGLRLLKAKKS